MTKNEQELSLEAMYGSDNNYWKHRQYRTVYIPRKAGRKNPKLIKADNFEFVRREHVVPVVAGAAALASNKQVQAGVKKGLQTVVGLVKGRTTDAVLVRNRDKIFDMFKKVGADQALDTAVGKHKMSHKDIPNQKLKGDYSEEWKRLYLMVIDTFNGMGRPDLAAAFQAQVPVYTTTVHPTEPIANLLSGKIAPTNTTQLEKVASVIPGAISGNNLYGTLSSAADLALQKKQELTNMKTPDIQFGTNVLTGKTPIEQQPNYPHDLKAGFDLGSINPMVIAGVVLLVIAIFVFKK